MRVLALIPARGGSKGVPKKNIALLGGKPLIAWTIEAALAASEVDRVVVSTDSYQVAEVARACGAEVPFLRPVELSEDDTPALPVIQHAVDWLEQETSWSAEAVAYLQPTSPFRTAADIDNAIALLENREADTVVSVVQVPHNMVPLSQMTTEGGWLRFSAPISGMPLRRQSKTKHLARNGPAILLNRRATVLSGRLYGERIVGYEMSRIASVDIDEPVDLLIAERLLPLAFPALCGTSESRS